VGRTGEGPELLPMLKEKSRNGNRPKGRRQDRSSRDIGGGNGDWNRDRGTRGTQQQKVESARADAGGGRKARLRGMSKRRGIQTRETQLERRRNGQGGCNLRTALNPEG